MKRLPFLPRPLTSTLSTLLVVVALTFASAGRLHAEDSYHYKIFSRDIHNFAAGNVPYETPMPLFHTQAEAEKAAKELIADLNKKASPGVHYTYTVEKEKKR